MSDLISREQAIKDAKSWVAVDEYEKHLKEIVIEWLKEFPSAELGTNLASLGTDCISRQAAIDALTEYGNGRAVFISVGEAVIRIEQLPPIQPNLLQPWEVLVAQAVLPQPKRGKWIRTGSGSLYDHYECSECGKPPKWECLGDNRWKIAFTDFCPNCGADMRQREE